MVKKCRIKQSGCTAYDNVCILYVYPLNARKGTFPLLISTRLPGEYLEDFLSDFQNILQVLLMKVIQTFECIKYKNTVFGELRV